MKKFLVIVPVLALVAGFFGFQQTASADWIDDLIPSCTVSVYPPYTVPVVLDCRPYTLPDGTVLNAIYVAHP